LFCGEPREKKEKNDFPFPNSREMVLSDYYLLSQQVFSILNAVRFLASILVY